MLSPELLKQIKLIQIRTSRIVNDVLAGEYQSAFRGRGMEFEEVREYMPGDEIRTIDWNVSARMNSPYVKQFREERELTVILMVDLSSSGEFGSVSQFKNEIAAEVAAILAYSAIKNNDKVGLIVFSSGIDLYIPPKKGRAHIYRVIKEILTIKPEAGKTSTKYCLEYLLKVVKRKAVCFLISDFIEEGLEHSLQLSNKKHDLIAVSITDPREVALPDVGFIELEDAETGEIILIDTSDFALRKSFAKSTDQSKNELSEMFRKCDIDHISIRTDTPIIDPIKRFFQKREKKNIRMIR